MRIAIMYSDRLPFAGVRPGKKDMERLAESFEIVAPENLRDALEISQYDCIVNLHGRYFPREGWHALVKQLKNGSGLVCLGSRVFTSPTDFIDNEWIVGADQTAFHRDINISNLYPVQTEGMVFQVREGFGLDADYAGLFEGGEVSEFSVHLTHAHDIPLEHGTSGTMDAVVEALVLAKNAEDRTVAAPVVMIENTRAAYAGGRWIFCNQDAGQLFWDKGGAAFLRDMAVWAAEGVTEFYCHPGYASYEPGEAPTIHYQIENLGHADFSTGNLKIEVMTGDKVEFIHQEMIPVSKNIQYWKQAVPISLSKGYHEIRTQLVLGTRQRIYITGLWVFDREEMLSGDFVSCDGDFFTRSGKVFPVCGMTYMDSYVHRKFLFMPNVATWMRDFAFMKEAGINMVRTGIWTSYRYVMYVDGVPYEEVMRAVDALVSVAKHFGIEVIFNFFGFTPETWEGLNPYLDPQSVAAQKRYISAIVSRYKDFPGISWDLINEPCVSNPRKPFRGPQPNRDRFELNAWHRWLEKRYMTVAKLQESLNLTGVLIQSFDDVPLPDDEDFNLVQYRDDIPQPPMRRVRALLAKDYAFFASDVFDAWAKDMKQQIRELTKDQMIAVGQDHATEGRRPHPQFHGRFLDYTAVHTWWQMDDIVWDVAMVKIPGKPALVQETGIMYVEGQRESSFRTEDQCSDILERKAVYAYAGGGAGVIPWVLNTNIYMDDEDEIHIGMLRPDMSEKPEFLNLRRFYQFIHSIKDRMPVTQTYDTFLVFPFANSYSNFAFANIATRKAARVLGYNLKARYCGCSDCHLDRLDDPKYIIYPSPSAIPQESWDALLRHAESGTRVLITGPIDWDNNWIKKERCEKLFGIPGSKRPVAREEQVTVNGKSSRAVFDGQLIGWVEKNDADTQAAGVYSCKVGKGEIVWCTLPLEMNREDAPVEDLYGWFLSCSPWHDTEGIFISQIPLTDGEWFQMVSETGIDKTIKVRGMLKGADYEVTVPAGRSIMFATDGRQITKRYGF